MKDRLKIVRRIIEKQTGFDIKKQCRERDVTYARAVFCRVARSVKTESGLPLSYSKIGSYVGRDHATVMHNCRVIFKHAYKEEPYRNLYNNVMSALDQLKDTESEEAVYSHIESIEDVSRKLSEANNKILELSYKISSYKNSSEKVSLLIQDLSDEEKEEVFERLNLIVKSIKSRVYR